MDQAQAFIEAGKAAGRECHDAALRYLSLGWPALCLCPPDHVGVDKGHACDHPGKRPLPDGGAWKQWQDRLPAAADLARWWKQHPNANVGVAMGHLPGLVGLDPDGPGGEAKLTEMSKGDLPPTLEFRRGPNRRLLYRIPPGMEFRSTYEAIGAKEELRFLSYGTQTVMPPSRHVSGDRYEWVTGHGPGEIEAAVCPPWLVEHMTAPRQRKSDTSLSEGELIDHGRRDTVLTSLAGTMRDRGMTKESIEAALLVENASRCNPPLPEGQVAKIARSVGKYPPDPFRGVTLVGAGPAPPGPTPPTEALLVCMNDVTPKPVRWLWVPWLSEGSLAILDGDPGLGKSTLTLDFAARITTGRSMPPLDVRGMGLAPKGVLLLGAEDSLEHTVRPRLDVAGADPKRIHTLEAVIQAGAQRPPMLPYDLDLVEERVRDLEIKLIVIDPLMAFIGGEYDAHKDQDIRRCLRPLAKLAERLDALILLLRHLNKLSGGVALYRGGASIGITGAARAALIVGRDPEDEDVRVLAMNKSNLGPIPKSLGYRLEQVNHPLAGPVARVVWTGELDLKPDQILGPSTRAKIEPGQQMARARNWLVNVLTLAPMTAKAVQEQAEKDGVAWRTVERAKKELGVQSKKFTEGWMWSLCQDEADGPSDPFPD